MSDRGPNYRIGFVGRVNWVTNLTCQTKMLSRGLSVVGSQKSIHLCMYVFLRAASCPGASASDS